MLTSFAAAVAVTAQLVPVGASHVSGTVSFSPAGNGTRAALSLVRVEPGPLRAVLRGGTCERPSASFAELPALRRAGGGSARGAGPVLFHGTISVGLTAIADGGHSVTVYAGRRSVACGAIPRLRR